MTLSYPYHGTPTIMACVEGPRMAGSPIIVSMLLDTGSCYTCLPCSFLDSLGHSLPSSPGIATCAVGSDVERHRYDARFGLLDPQAASSSIIWRSALPKLKFINQEMPCGLIGMDVIGQWSEFTVIPNRKDGLGTIRIVIAD